MGQQISRRSFLNGFFADQSLLLDFQKKVDNGKLNTYILERWFNMKEILLFLGIIAIWYVLQAYILPKMGIPTWLRNSCQVTSNYDDSKESKPQDN